MQQTWNDLLFAHWPINPDVMRPLIPSVLALDTFNGECWVAVTPFHMSDIRARFMPQLPGLSAFPELNVRTYVNYRGKPGVYFFSLDAGSRVAAWTARLTYHLPYFHARMSSIDREGWIYYHSIRDSKAELKGRFRPVAPVQLRNPATIEHWLSERYCLYAMHHGRVYRAEIHHEPWPLQDAECEFSVNSMATSAGIQLPATQPLAHFAKCLEVLIWPLKRA
jgi:uncharacterized protein YqjF (DUF2071 family)